MTDLEQTLERILGPIIRKAVCAELDARQVATRVAELVTVQAFAAARSISVSTVRAAIRDGRLEAVRVGRAVRLRADAELGEPVRATKAVTPASVADRVLAGGRR